MKSRDTLSRRDFIFKLTKELREDYLEEIKARRCVKKLTKSYAAAPTKATKRKQCQIVANCAHNKTKKRCYEWNNMYAASALQENWLNASHVQTCNDGSSM